MVKIKGFLKKSATLLTSLVFLLMANVVVTTAAEQTFNGVKLTVTPAEESYTVGGAPTTVNVKFENTNPYAITVKTNTDEVLKSSHFIVEDTSIVPETITLAAKEAKTYDVPVSYTFEQFKTLDFYNVKTGKQETIKVGVTSSYPRIAKGSEFIVDCHDITEEQYRNMLPNLDVSKHSAGAERILFFDLNIQDKAGNKSKQLGGPVKVWFQVPTGWDAKELQAIYTPDTKDEHFVEKMETRDGVQYVTFITDHFSPYALVDPKSTKTGDTTMFIILPLVVSAMLFLVLCLVMGRKRRTTVMAVVLSAGLGLSALVASASIQEFTMPDGLDLKLNFHDFVKRENEKSEDVAPVDASIDTRFDVTYDGPELSDLVEDYDYMEAYAFDYYGGPFKILIKGGPAGWVGYLKVYDSAGAEKSSHEVDFNKLQVDNDGNHIFKFDPTPGEGNGNELDVGYTLKLIDKHGNVVDTVKLETGDFQEHAKEG